MNSRSLLGAIAISAMSIAGAQAADVVVDEVVLAPPPAPAASWDGLFVGLHTGYGWSETNVTRAGPGPSWAVPADVDGVLGGLQIGYNFQHNNLLFGVIGDVSLTGMSESGVAPFGPPITWDNEYNYLATIRGRVGWIWNDSTLIYAHGGVAFTDMETTFAAPGPVDGLTISGDDTGWVAGAGVEASVSDRVTVFAEYSYIDFGSTNSLSPGGPFTYTQDNDPINAVKIGVNFKLWQPGN